MSQPAIRIEGLAKRYQIGAAARRHTTFREALSGAINSPWRRFRDLSDDSSSSETFWALKDVSFDVQPGEIVGIIGRNGAGKSTLLKILSRITEPTRGRVEMRGRVGSLLEVGTGFHPELTGRENVYLNGAMLGMSRREVVAKFDEIVDFSGIGQFIDTPVKRYSSGMYMRLAFAVAAHLEPEILIVDEVLAVGDSEFQEKCLGKMAEVSRGGRTVLFVSHNTHAVRHLTGTCLLLDSGRLSHHGPTIDVLTAYHRSVGEQDEYACPIVDRGRTQIAAVSMPPTRGDHSDRLTAIVQIHSPRRMTVSLDAEVCDSHGAGVGFGSLGAFGSGDLIRLEEGMNTVCFALRLSDLAVGRYVLSLRVTIPDAETLDRVPNCLGFTWTRNPQGGESRVLDQDWKLGCWQLEMKRLRPPVACPAEDHVAWTST